MTESASQLSPGQAVADWWGDDLRIETVSRLVAAPIEHWAAFSESYLELRSNSEPGLADLAAVYCSVSSRSDELYEADLIPLADSRVRALALYANRILVKDPLEGLAQDFINGTRTPDVEPPSEQALHECLRMLAALTPLETAGALSYAGKSSGMSAVDEVSALRGLLSVQADLSLDTLDWRWATDPRRVRGDASGMVAALHILADLMQARRVAPEGAVFIGTPLERSVLQRMVELGGPSVGTHATALANLSTLAVPVLIPSPKDVVAARGPDEYVGLRAELGRALAMVEDLPSTDESWLVTARALLDDELAAGRERVAKSIRKSKALREMRQTTANFSIAALGATAGMEVGGHPIPTIAGAATTGLANSLRAYLTSRRGVRQQKAVLESYMMFGRPS
jgi:hypothetical protein